MKLRNKKTGEMANFVIEGDVIRESCLFGKTYYSLAELNEEWEDYEEPKEYWIIDWTSSERIDVFKYSGDDVDIFNKSIGNYFKSKEEAEKAVEKLKAWKRLKDKGFRFNGGDDACISYEMDIEHWTTQDLQDFKTLFGGEE